MKINHQNYESYFLSYVDNELSASEKKEVDLFIAQYPAYAESLSLLQQAVLIPEEIQYEDKMLLYRYSEMEATLNTNFKQSLYRNETKVIKGFFNTNTLRYLSIAAVFLFCIIGYQWIGTDSTNQKPLTLKNSQPSQVQTEAITGMQKMQYKEAPIAKSNSKQFEMDKATTPITITTSTSTDQSSYTKLELNTGIPIVALVENQNKRVFNTTEKTTLQAPTETTMTPIVNTITSLSENNVEDFEDVNTDNSDRTIYVANLEIDGEKLRGLGRRFNAFLKKNKNR
jgi:hypothetical protein